MILSGKLGRNGKDKRLKNVGSDCSVHEHWHEKSRHAHPSWTSADSWNEIFESRNQRIKESLNQKATLQDIAGCESKTSTEKIGDGEGFLTMVVLLGRTMYHKDVKI